MKKIIASLYIIISFSTQAFSEESLSPASHLSDVEKEGIIKKATSLKLPWIENNGRQDSTVAYYTGIPDGNVYITKKGEIVYHTIHKLTSESKSKKNAPLHGALIKEDKVSIHGNVWRENFIGGEIKSIKPEYTSPSTVSYFIGNDPSKWEKGKSTHYTVSLGKIWKNIEVKLNKSGNSIEKRFYIYPGGSVTDIAIQITGCEKLAIAEDGSLTTNDKPITENEQMRFNPPVAYQYIADKKVIVPVHYLLKGKTYGFKIGAYNPEYTLVIDPLLSTLSASTYIGGSYYDYSNSITLDAAGNVYIASATLCTDYPTTTGAYQTSNAGNLSAYVSEFNSDLSSLLASTYIGGGNSNNQAMFVTVAPSGDIFITGQTLANNFPTTIGAYQATYGGGDFDDFVSKFNPGLTDLLASTYLGGSGNDLAYSIAFDNPGNVYLAGFTTSANFPATTGAYSTTIKGSGNAFITMMDPNLATVMISTFIGGSANDYGYSIARDATGNLYISGQTTSPDYPTTVNAYQAHLNGASDTYVSKMNSTLTTLLASTYFGGSGGEQTNTLILDKDDNVYLTGWENSSDFPVTSRAYQTSYGGGQNDAYVSKLDSTLSNLLASTYIGGSSDDYGYGLAVDASGTIYLSGFTGGNSASSNYPTTSGSFQPTYGGGYYDAFVSILDNSLTTLQESTFVGGSGSDFGYTLALSPSGNLYITGQTQSSNYPTTTGSYQPANAGAADVFVTKFGSALSPPPSAQFIVTDTNICSGNAVSFTDQSTGAPASWQWTFTGGNPANSASPNPSVTYSITGTYSIKLVVSNSSGTDSLTKSVYITVNTPPVAGVVAGPAAICSGASAQLTDTGSTGSLQWQSSADGISFADITGDTFSIYNADSLLQTTYYRMKATGICGSDSSAVFKLLVNPLPIPVVSTQDSLLCSGDSSLVCSSSPFVSYLWNNNDTSSCTMAKLAGGYWVSVTDINGCSAVSGHQNIYVHPVSSVSIIVQGDTLASFNSNTYQWYLDDTIIQGANTSVYIAHQTGNYAVQIVDTNGCSELSDNTPVIISGITDLPDNSELTIYPNPCTNQFFVRYDNAGIHLQGIEIYDVLGRMVLNKDMIQPSINSLIVDVTELPEGIYNVNIKTSEQTYTQKIIKQ